MSQNKGFWLSMARVQSKKHKGNTIDDLVSFFQQFSTLLNAGTPLLSSLRLAGEQSESEKLSKVIKEIANKVASGDSFHKAASNYPKIFENHWIQMMRTGEVSGQLGSLMLQLNISIQKERATRSKVTGALIYPIILIGVAFLSLFVMLWKVVPTFAAFFKDFGSELPAITEYVIAMSNFIKDRGLLILVGMAVGGYFFRRYVRTEDGNRQVRSILMALPVMGELLVQSSMEKFASNLSLLLRSGTPLLESIKTTQEVFRSDPIYFSALGTVHGHISRGSNLVASVESTKLFTVMMLSMIKIGEESGKLSEVLDQIAGYYQNRVETLVTRLTGLMEPMIVIGMGVMVCGLLASIYIPMFQMAGGG